MEIEALAEAVCRGETRALARALRVVDDRRDTATALLRALFPKTGNATIVGVTGNPGAGKSTLTDRLIAAYRKAGKRVGVLAVDPSSPYSGGAILGDRIRMQRHALDEGVFIRSVATRGHLGGLSRSARDMIRVMDASGFDVVLVETVGVGQDELEITRTAHTTLVVMAPGLGDEVQAIKAGLLECADVFCVNKADRDGADATVRDLELMIALGTESMIAIGKTRGHVVHGAAAEGGRDLAAHGGAPSAGSNERWIPPIVKAIAVKNEGVDELVIQLDRHAAWLSSSAEGRARKTGRLAEEVRESLREALLDAALAEFGEGLEQVVLDVAAKKVDPYVAIDDLVAKFRAR